MKLDIRAEMRPDGWWEAIDLETYDCDCDETGYYPISPVGHGVTAYNAIRDLLDQTFERGDYAKE